jgi:hypothetical protein
MKDAAGGALLPLCIKTGATKTLVFIAPFLKIACGKS